MPENTFVYIFLRHLCKPLGYRRQLFAVTVHYLEKLHHFVSPKTLLRLRVTVRVRVGDRVRVRVGWG